MKHTVIYVPGILDDIYHAQSIIVRFWRLLGVRCVCHEMPWAGDESYESKFAKLLTLIDGYLERGHMVSLVAASAGASAVLNAYDARRGHINGVVLICAKINRPETVSEHTYATNPAFRSSLQELQKVLKRLTAKDTNTMLSFYSSIDTSVPFQDTVIPGVAEKRLPALKHGYAIVYGLTLKAPAIIRFLKQSTK